MRKLNHTQLLGMMPALAVAAMDARVREEVQEGRLSPYPFAGEQTVQQAIDKRRANFLLQDCKADVGRETTEAYRRPVRPADLSRAHEAARRLASAEALYRATWYGWYR